MTDENLLAISEDAQKFELMQREAKALAQSDMIPKRFRGSVANCLLAVQMAKSLSVGSTPIQPVFLMKQIYFVHDQPELQGQAVIALVNMRGPYKENLHFEYSGSGDTRSCDCVGVRENGEDRSTVNVATAKSMGWWGKNPIWKSMTDQMLAYRSATWLARLNCPEVLMGMSTEGEVKDVGETTELVDSDVSIEQLNEEIGLIEHVDTKTGEVVERVVEAPKKKAKKKMKKEQQENLDGLLL